VAVPVSLSGGKMVAVPGTTAHGRFSYFVRALASLVHGPGSKSSAYAALPAIGRLSINARARDWFCAVLLTLITYPPVTLGRIDVWHPPVSFLVFSGQLAMPASMPHPVRAPDVRTSRKAEPEELPFGTHSL
jgi:hypothetical protein